MLAVDPGVAAQALSVKFFAATIDPLESEQPVIKDMPLSDPTVGRAGRMLRGCRWGLGTG